MPRSWLTPGAVLASVLLPSAALACACGCAIFDVGTSTLLPSGPGGTVFFEWDYLDQTKNWHGSSRAPAANNDDKDIRSNFYLAGGQYMFNDDWGAMVEVPFTDRHFVTANSGSPEAFDHSSLRRRAADGRLFRFLARHVDRRDLRREAADRRFDLQELRSGCGDRFWQHGYPPRRLSHRLL